MHSPTQPSSYSPSYPPMSTTSKDQARYELPHPCDNQGVTVTQESYIVSPCMKKAGVGSCQGVCLTGQGKCCPSRRPYGGANASGGITLFWSGNFCDPLDMCWTEILAEFIGSTLLIAGLMWLSMYTCRLNANVDLPLVSEIAFSLMVFFLMAAILAWTGVFSGSILNVHYLLIAWCFNGLQCIKVIIYVILFALSAFTAALLVWIFWSSSVCHFGTPQPGICSTLITSSLTTQPESGLGSVIGGIGSVVVNLPVPCNTLQVFLAELFGTFILLVGIYYINKCKTSCSILYIAALFALLEFIFVPISGGSFNFFRFLGPAVISGNWELWWVYLVAPIVASIFAVMLIAGMNCLYDSCCEKRRNAELNLSKKTDFSF